MVRNCKQRVRREMLDPVGSNWTLYVYNSQSYGCGSCGSCEVWCCMKHELRADERKSLSFSWPQRLSPQMHKAGNGACGRALGTVLAGNGGETRSSGHLSLPRSWGPPASVNDLSAAAPWLPLPLPWPLCQGWRGLSCCSCSLHWLTRAGTLQLSHRGTEV